MYNTAYVVTLYNSFSLSFVFLLSSILQLLYYLCIMLIGTPVNHVSDHHS